MFKRQNENRSNEIQDFISRMAYIAEIKEWDNRTHLERIRRFSYIVASGMGLLPNEAEILSLASQLHDVGKVLMPDTLLTRKGNFQNSEWKTIEKHTIDGALLLQGSASPILEMGKVIAFTHHERWDGSGYPEKMKKEDIPISGRIVGLVDVFDALTSKRDYKDVMDDNAALKIILQAGGVLFDPKVAAAFEMKFNEIVKVKNTLLELNR
jgi:putative two-component system response regulator